MLLELKLPRTDEVIRPLFFPCNADYMGRILRGPLAVDAKYFSTGGYTLPRLEKPITWKRQTYHTRRPGFLAALNSTQYVKAFEALGNKEMYTTTIPQWNTFVKLSKYASEPLKKILQHVMFWYLPSWRYPKQASNQLKTFNWINTIADSLFVEASGTPEEIFETSLVFVKELWDYVYKHKDEFAIQALEEYVSIIPTKV